MTWSTDAEKCVTVCIVVTLIVRVSQAAKKLTEPMTDMVHQPVNHGMEGATSLVVAALGQKVESIAQFCARGIRHPTKRHLHQLTFVGYFDRQM